MEENAGVTSRRISDHLVHLGSLEIDDRKLPAYLARGLNSPGAFGKVDRQIRSETATARGVVFVPRSTLYEFAGTHVVVPLSELVAGNSDAAVEPGDVAERYRASAAPAEAGEAVGFRKRAPGAAVLKIPDADPWQIDGKARVDVVETLYNAYVNRSGPVTTGALMAGVESEHPSQLFGKEWERIKNVYIRSPRRTQWELCV